MSTDQLLANIQKRMEARDTKELLAIWEENDRRLWSDLAFEAIQEILSERGVDLPQQGERKYSAPPITPSKIPWAIPAISCTFFTVFLLWVFFIHPFFFVSQSSGPLWPDVKLSLEAFSRVKNIDSFGKLVTTLHYIEFGTMSFGWIVGYNLARKNRRTIALTKLYLTQFFLFSITLLLFFNITLWWRRIGK